MRIKKMNVLQDHVVSALGELERLEYYIDDCVVDAAIVDGAKARAWVRSVSRILKDGMLLSVSGAGATK